MQVVLGGGGDRRQHCAAILADFRRVHIDAIIDAQRVEVAHVFYVKVGEVQNDGLAQRRYYVEGAHFVVLVRLGIPWRLDDAAVFIVKVSATNCESKKQI